ncbi:hypothetical protein Rhe02_52190 [Rhizocola hellebori]|uniref:DUF2997 domain-containing protein n=1 Tax=Rhizocola hellebori TaxID=1392758 RepID=A0A8J3VI99_9ACTN|nr:DUF2997 domain-containing protein [Rhizocola hellebori]GIH07152.1 hypothetical protein Rhe02_52190 [Rhizocola hellebori]
MAEEIIEVTISPKGKVEVHLRGIAGMGCVEETRELFALLGDDVESQELTPEAFAEVSQEQQNRLWS